jgi:glycosyl transferase family 25
MSDKEARGELELAVISLASAHERRRRVLEQLKDFPLRWLIFEAKTTPPAGLPYRESDSLARRGRILGPAELGAFASHYECMRAFVDQSAAAYRLVIEDDVYIDPGFAYARLPMLMSSCGIEYLRLHATFLRPHRLLGQVSEHRKLVRFLLPTFGGVAAYVVSKRGARQFLASLSSVVRPVDDELDRFWHNGLPPYALYPFPALHLSGPSTVAKTAPAWRTFPPAQRAKYVLYRAKERLEVELCNLRLRARDRAIAERLRQWPAAQAI